jgi:hypothetical protein
MCIMDIMRASNSTPYYAAVLGPRRVQVRPVRKAMEQVTASLSKSRSGLSSFYAVLIFEEQAPQRADVLSATRTFFTAYKRGLKALSDNAQAILTHPDLDHLHSLKTRDFGEVCLYWGKATTEEVKRRILPSPGIYILVSDLDRTLLKDLDLPLVPKIFEKIPLLFQVPHHGSSETIGKLSVAVGQTEEVNAEKTPGKETLAWRKRFMEENSCLTSDQVAEEATSQATNRAAIASRWMKERKVFSVRFEGTQWFPKFQFQDGRPIPAIAEVMEVFPEQASGWELAYFFVTSNSKIHGRKPVELVKEDPRRLVSLAQAFVHPADVF